MAPEAFQGTIEDCVGCGDVGDGENLGKERRVATEDTGQQGDASMGETLGSHSCHFPLQGGWLEGEFIGKEAIFSRNGIAVIIARRRRYKAGLSQQEGFDN